MICRVPCRNMYVVLRVFQAANSMLLQIFTPQFATIARAGYRRCSKGPMDDPGQYGYRSDNAPMTESWRVDDGAVATASPIRGLGKEPN